MFFNKKAAGDAISALILFIAVVAVSTGLVIAMKNYAIDTQDSFETQSDLLNNQLRTSIEITNIYFNTTNNATYIYVKNLGETRLPTEDFDIFLNDEFQTNFGVVSATNLSVNVTVLQISQTARFVVLKNITSGSHEVKVVSGYGGNGDSDFFNN